MNSSKNSSRNQLSTPEFFFLDIGQKLFCPVLFNKFHNRKNFIALFFRTFFRPVMGKWKFCSANFIIHRTNLMALLHLTGNYLLHLTDYAKNLHFRVQKHNKPQPTLACRGVHYPLLSNLLVLDCSSLYLKLVQSCPWTIMICLKNLKSPKARNGFWFLSMLKFKRANIFIFHAQITSKPFVFSCLLGNKNYLLIT
jgi:hypothetical protein